MIFEIQSLKSNALAKISAWRQAKGAASAPQEDLARRLASVVNKAIPAYKEILERWPGTIFPVSKLPLSKTQMKTALKVAWAATRVPADRDWLSVAYSSLSMFQDDVFNPLDMPLLPPGASWLQCKEVLNGPYLAILEKVAAERSELLREFESFTLAV